MSDAVAESRVLPLFPTFVWYLQLADEVKDPIYAAILARLEEMATAPAPTPAVLGEIVRGDATHDDPDYVRLVAEAIGDIRSGELDKVVLARVFTR